MDMEMRRLRLRYSIIHARRELINAGLKAGEDSIAVVPMEDMPIMLWPQNTYEENDTFIEPLAANINQVTLQHINLSFPVGGYYDSWDLFKEEPERPQHFFSIDPIGIHKRDEGNYLVGFTRGYYAEIGDLPQRMDLYAKENGIGLSGPVYITYLLEETCMSSPSEYLAQVCISATNLSQNSRRRQADIRGELRSRNTGNA